MLYSQRFIKFGMGPRTLQLDSQKEEGNSSFIGPDIILGGFL